jgi:hypothetical protein
MSTKSGIDQVKAENQRIGLAFGVLMGFAFVLGAWGSDAYQMWQASAQLPWLRLALGAVLVVPLAGLVGWLVALSDSALVGLLCWLGAGVLFSYWAGHIPYELFSGVVGKLIPDFQGLPIYPFNESALTRLWTAAGLAGVLLGIGGAMQTIAVDSARATSNIYRRFFSFLVCLPFFIGAGILVDLLIQRPLRQPVVVVNDLIQLALDTEEHPVDKDTARSLHLGALKSISSLLHQPRRLIMGDFDLESLDSGRVLVNFNGEWVRCWVIAGQPSFCQLSRDFYGDAFTCLWETGGQGREGCQVKLGEEAGAWFESWSSQGGDPWSMKPEVQVRSQFGAVALLTVKLGQNSFDCRFLDSPTLTLDSCSPAGGQVESSQALSPAFTPTAQAEPGQGQSSAISRQAQALLPEMRADLGDMPGLNQYDLSVTLNPDQTFQGKMVVDYTNTETETLDSLYFRLFPNGGASYGDGSLTAGEVKVGGQPAQTNLSLSDSVLEVQLPQALAPDDQVQISMIFTGTVPVDYGGEGTDAYGIYNYSKGVLALSGWYPILAVYDDQGWHLNPASALGDSVFSDMAFYTVAITSGKDQVLAATGVQIGEKQEGNKIQHQYISGPARDFFIVSSSDFKVKSQSSAGTKVNSYYLPGQEPGGTQGLAVGVKAVQVYNDRFGQYPYTELDIIDAPMRNAGGVEFPGIVLIESSRYDDPENPVFINTVAHEVAHQWWYNLIGNDVIQEPWLDEGLTTYSAGVYYEEAFGAQGYQGIASYWQQSYDKAVQAVNDDQVTRSLTYFESSSEPRLYGPIVYSKGALFFYNLRTEIGDRAFFAALQAYFRQFRYKIATGDDLLKAFEDASGKHLDALYQQWLYSP